MEQNDGGVLVHEEASIDEAPPYSGPTLLAERPNIQPPRASPSLGSATSTLQPSDSPSAFSTKVPSQSPSKRPSWRPSDFPSVVPSMFPSYRPSFTERPSHVSYFPGNLTREQNGLLLSEGLVSRVLAVSGEPVQYDTARRLNIFEKNSSSGNGNNNNITQESSHVFHDLPDYGTTFVDDRQGNEGGWIYVSNSEVRGEGGNGGFGRGGVGALTFDKAGNVIDYRMILNNTTSNCGGGPTPWNTFVSCEEFKDGRIWQVDPTGVRRPKIIKLGNDTGGFFESFSCDVRNPATPYFFVTEDARDGPLRRFRPYSPDWTDPWSILLGDGHTDYLVLNPTNSTGGTFSWTDDRSAAKESASSYYPHSEGIDISDGRLFFISKLDKSLITLHLDDWLYTVESTKHGLFNGQPDQIQHILHDKENDEDEEEMFYFTEDGSGHAGIHARNKRGQYFTIMQVILEGDKAETTGLAFSPDYRFLYMAFQKNGTLFEISREDGLAFYGAKTLNVKYHNLVETET